jgi:co-chaperonin GroES (HSP10)
VDNAVQRVQSGTLAIPKTERAARQQGSSSSGRIVPTEAKPSELSGCIVGAGEGSVKEKSRGNKLFDSIVANHFGKNPAKLSSTCLRLFLPCIFRLFRVFLRVYACFPQV